MTAVDRVLATACSFSRVWAASVRLLERYRTIAETVDSLRSGTGDF